MSASGDPSLLPDGNPWYASAFDDEYYDAFHPMLTPEMTREETDFLVEKLALPEGARILDLCCGQGRHAIELARRGFAVTGLDLSTYLLDIARREAADAGVEVAFIHADMRRIPKPREPYDAVINMFSAYGYLETDEEDQKSLAASARVLRPGGAFLVDTMNREAILRYNQPWHWAEHADGALFAARMRWDIREGRQYVTEVLIRPDGRRTEDSYSYRTYAYTEIARHLREEGFDPATFQVWGGFDSSRYTWDSGRMIVLARLPEA